jgi:hypothetical protein
MARPTKYKKKYCKELYEHLKTSGICDAYAVRFCAEIGICEDTFYRWVKVHPEFSEAYKRGRTAAKAKFLNRIGTFAFGDQEDEKRCNNGLISLLAVNLYGMTTEKSARAEEDAPAAPVEIKFVLDE